MFAPRLAILLALTVVPSIFHAQPVGEIRIHRVNVFDPAHPDENRPPYTWANKLHIMTREKVIRREMLLAPGDPYSAYLKEESERNIRRYSFIKSVRIEEKPGVSGALDLDVYTQDTWTTDVAPTLGRSGGKTTWGLLARERNLLGRGRTLELSYNEGFDFIGRTVRYSDPRLGGTRWRLKTYHTDLSGGFKNSTRLTLPLYSLLTPYYAGFSVSHFSIFDRIFEEGNEIAAFKRNARYNEFFAGRSLISTTDHALRLALGYRTETEHFRSSHAAAGVVHPQDRRRRQIQAVFQYEESDYVEESFVNQFDRVEDFNLGWEASLTGRHSARKLGSRRDDATAILSAGRGVSLAPGRFITFHVDVASDYEGSRPAQMLQTLSVNAYLKDFIWNRNTLVAHAEAASGRRFYPETQLVLGGNAGLRGYKINAFSGVKSALFNVEHRWHAVTDFLHVVSIAPTLFWDAGYVWPRFDRVRFQDLKHDLGAGLRFGFTRSATNPILRMDLSYALSGDGVPGSRWVFSLSTYKAFGPKGNSLASNLEED